LHPNTSFGSEKFKEVSIKHDSKHAFHSAHVKLQKAQQLKATCNTPRYMILNKEYGFKKSLMMRYTMLIKILTQCWQMNEKNAICT
jgi:hypothetical protein